MAKEGENGGREKMAVPRFFLVPPLSVCGAEEHASTISLLSSSPHTHSLFDKPGGGNSEPRLLQVVDTSELRGTSGSAIGNGRYT